MNRLIRDLRQRRNLDVYVTIVVALVVSVLVLLEVVDQTRIVPLILAVLAVMAYSSLATRDIVAAGAQPSTVTLHREFLPDLIPRRNKSSDLLLIGVSLDRTIETSYKSFEGTLARGGRIRIVLTDPAASNAAVDARCQAKLPSLEEIRNEIRSSLRTLAKLGVSGGDLQVRTTKMALKFGLNYLDVSKTAATMHVQMYSFRSHGESRPILVLTVRDGEWFEYYKDQAEGIWADADPVDLTTYI
jgi:hypothetical protein